MNLREYLISKPTLKTDILTLFKSFSNIENLNYDDIIASLVNNYVFDVYLIKFHEMELLTTNFDIYFKTIIVEYFPNIVLSIKQNNFIMSKIYNNVDQFILNNESTNSTIASITGYDSESDFNKVTAITNSKDDNKLNFLYLMNNELTPIFKKIDNLLIEYLQVYYVI